MEKIGFRSPLKFSRFKLAGFEAANLTLTAHCPVSDSLHLCPSPLVPTVSSILPTPPPTLPALARLHSLMPASPSGGNPLVPTEG